jgi:hypothetical protein
MKKQNTVRVRLSEAGLPHVIEVGGEVVLDLLPSTRTIKCLPPLLSALRASGRRRLEAIVRAARARKEAGV